MTAARRDFTSSSRSPRLRHHPGYRWARISTPAAGGANQVSTSSGPSSPSSPQGRHRLTVMLIGGADGNQSQTRRCPQTGVRPGRPSLRRSWPTAWSAGCRRSGGNNRALATSACGPQTAGSAAWDGVSPQPAQAPENSNRGSELGAAHREKSPARGPAMAGFRTSAAPVSYQPDGRLVHHGDGALALVFLISPGPRRTGLPRTGRSQCNPPDRELQVLAAVEETLGGDRHRLQRCLRGGCQPVLMVELGPQRPMRGRQKTQLPHWMQISGAKSGSAAISRFSKRLVAVG